MVLRSFIIGASVLLAAHCNNYGLLEKLQNPRGERANTHYMFVSTYMTNGTMTGLSNGGCSGGSTGQADCACRDMAKAAGLPGSENYMAWLSKSGDAAICRMQGLTASTCGVSSTQSWYTTKDEVIAVSLGELISQTLRVPVKYTEYDIPTVASEVFTGTNPTGVTATNHCSEWTTNSSGVQANIGNPYATNPDWSQIGTGTSACDIPHPVYCIRKT